MTKQGHTMITGDRYVGNYVEALVGTRWEKKGWKLINRRGDEVVWEWVTLNENGVVVAERDGEVIVQWSNPKSIVRQISERLSGHTFRAIHPEEIKNDIESDRTWAATVNHTA